MIIAIISLSTVVNAAPATDEREVHEPAGAMRHRSGRFV
jgi:hypothetical protein